MPRRAPSRHGGFTLIELLMALTILAVIALLSWRGIDTLARSKERTEAHAQAMSRLGHGLAQWQADLDAMEPTGETQALAFDGQSLRLTRRDADPASSSMRVVAWTLRSAESGSLWLRWVSPPVSTRTEVSQAWQAAALWATNPSATARQSEVAIAPATQWQLYYYRNDAWVNPQSASDPASEGLPDGVRLELDLAMPDGLQGRLQRDWVRPTQGGGKS